MNVRASRSATDRVGENGRRQLRSLHESRELEAVNGAATATRGRAGKLKVADGVGIVKHGAVVRNKLSQCRRRRGVQLSVQRERCGGQHRGRGGLGNGDVGRGEWSHGVDVCVALSLELRAYSEELDECVGFMWLACVDLVEALNGSLLRVIWERKGTAKKEGGRCARWCSK